MIRYLLLLSLLITGCSFSKKQELNVFVWSEYFSPQAIAKFEKEHHCTVILDTYDTNESMYAKLKLGSSGYDVIFPSNYIFDILVEQHMLHPLDYTQMTNIRFFQRDKAVQVGVDTTLYGIPFVVTYTGLGYRKDRIPDFDPTWTVFAQRNLRGRMTMLNDMREALGAALLTLGYSINTINPKEIQEAADLLIKWKKNIAKFENEQYKNGLASAEYLVVQGYNSDIMQVSLEENVGFAYPKEGSVCSVDYIAIPANAHNFELAQAFVNFLLRPEIAALNMNHSITGTFIEFDETLIRPIIKNHAILYPPEEVRQRTQLLKNVGKNLELYTSAWERVLTEN